MACPYYPCLNMHISHGTLNSMDSQTELRTLDEYDLVRFQKEHPQTGTNHQVGIRPE